MVWYEDEVKRVEQEKNKLPYTPRVVFYGSSSINLWPDLYINFRAFDPVNLGFGGSTMEACAVYFDRIMAGIDAKHIVCYAGDNDLGDGKKSEEVIHYFKQLKAHIRKKYPHARFTFISIKPSIARWHIIGEIRMVNARVKELLQKEGPGNYYLNVFDRMLDSKGQPLANLLQPDGLHLSAAGYALWQEILLTHLHETSVL